MAFNSLHQQGGVDSSSSSLDDEAGKSAENLEAEIDRDSDNPPAVKFETVANYERKSGFGDIWTCLAVYGLICAFCILGPILALGWMLLPFTHGMWHFAAFVTAYCVTQNLPPFYLRAYKQGPIGGIFIRELVYYMTPFKVVKEATLDLRNTFSHGTRTGGYSMALAPSSAFSSNGSLRLQTPARTSSPASTTSCSAFLS